VKSPLFVLEPVRGRITVAPGTKPKAKLEGKTGATMTARSALWQRGLEISSFQSGWYRRGAKRLRPELWGGRPAGKQPGTPSLWSSCIPKLPASLSRRFRTGPQLAGRPSLRSIVRWEPSPSGILPPRAARPGKPFGAPCYHRIGMRYTATTRGSAKTQPPGSRQPSPKEKSAKRTQLTLLFSTKRYAERTQFGEPMEGKVGPAQIGGPIVHLGTSTLNLPFGRNG
jgi:hypothetical protein